MRNKERYNLKYLWKINIIDKSECKLIKFVKGKKAKYFWQDDIEEGFYFFGDKINIEKFNDNIFEDEKAYYKPRVIFYVARETITKYFDTFEEAENYVEMYRSMTFREL